MTEIAWLAAVLSPRSVARHPNFGSDRRTTAGRFAALVQQDHSFDRGDPAAAVPTTAAEGELLAAVAMSMDGASTVEGTARLAAFAANPDFDPAMRVAATLLAVVVLAELDQQDAMFRLLDMVIESLTTDSDDGRLLRGVLMQQRAMRTCDAGKPFTHHRLEAREVLDTVKVSAVSRYPTSQGSLWTAGGTNREILAALAAANDDLERVEMGFPDPKTLKQWLRRKDPTLISRAYQAASSGDDVFIDERFAEVVRNPATSLRALDPVDHPQWQALMFFEFLGHYGGVRSYRRTLGQLRLIRHRDNPALVRDALRLLRKSGDAKTHGLALSSVWADGPLTSLKDEADAVAGLPIDRLPLGESELATLESGAQLLDAQFAADAFHLAIGSMSAPADDGPRTWTHRAIKLRNALVAAASLAPVAGRASELASALLDSAEANAGTEDELLVSAHTAAAQRLDWAQVDGAITMSWHAWLVRHADEQGVWRSLVDIVRLMVESGTQPAAPYLVSTQTVVNHLNEVLLDRPAGKKSKEWLRTDGAEFIRDLLNQGRREAAEGRFAWGGYEPSDLAVAVIQATGADLWSDVFEYVVDARIPRNKRASAFVRIAAAPDTVPTEVRARFEQRASGLLAEDDIARLFDGPIIKPFPEALRALSAMGALTADVLVSSVARLASQSPEARLEAARTLTSIAGAQAEVPDWIVAMGLQLSNDATANVKAEAGRTLATVRTKSRFAAAVIDERLQGLLAQDGVLVPLLTLQALGADGVALPPRIADQIAGMRDAHSVFGIRIAAEQVLGEAGSPRYQ